MGSQFNVDLIINNSLIATISSLLYVEYVENPKIPTNLSYYFSI
jgi:hypothetical protein